MIYWPTKTPAAVRDHGANWGPTLSRIGRLLSIPDPTIENSVWTRLNGTATIIADSIDPNQRRTVARVSGGNPNSVTVFRNQVTLSNGLILTEDVFQKVRA